MPLFLIPLVEWFSATFFSLAMWFITRGGIRVAQAVVLIAALGVAINFFVSQASSLLASILPSAVPFVSAFLPSNTSLCLSIVVSTELLATGYKLTIKLIEYKSRIFLA